MAKITTAERVSRGSLDNFVFQRSLLAYHAAAQRISGDVLGDRHGGRLRHRGRGAPRPESFVTIDKTGPPHPNRRSPNVEFRRRQFCRCPRKRQF